VHGRAELVRRVVEQGRPVAHVAAEMNVSRATGYKWLARWRAEGRAGLADRLSCAHRQPRRTPPQVEQRILALRADRKLGPARIAPLVGLAPSTVHAVLTRHGLHRLAWLDRPTGQLIRRYERPRPGELIHVDVKKLGAIRPGGGWRAHGRSSALRRPMPSSRWCGARTSWKRMRTAVLRDADWARIEPLLRSSVGCPGRPFRDHRQVVEGIVYAQLGGRRAA
jgi:transposase-like protein